MNTLSPSASRSIDVVVAGYLGVDLTPGFSSTRTAVSFCELFRPGKLIETEGLDVSLGGVVANTGLAMRKFGQRVELMGCVGTDALGDLAVARLAQAGVSRGIRRNHRLGTAYGLVIAPPGLDRLFLEDPGCNRSFTADDLDDEVISQSRLFHFGYPPLMESLWTNGGVELQKLFQRVRERGVATSLDMTLPDPESPAGKADWAAILAATLPLVDIFVPSIEEVLFMLDAAAYARFRASAGDQDMVEVIPKEVFEEMGQRLLAMGVKVALIKAGHRGAFLRTGDVSSINVRTALRLSPEQWNDRSLWVPPMPRDPKMIRNACGAGDCAVAAFLTAILKGDAPETAARYAMLAGRDNLYGQDAFSGLREWTEMVREEEKWQTEK
jgi:sugar/nucleoside kinase (ribokinase family)